MKTNFRKSSAIISMVVLSCVLMAAVDGILMPDYFVKSAIKLVLFLVLPVGYSFFDKDTKIKSLFVPHRRGLYVALLLGVSVFAVIFLGYLLLRNVFDFSAVTGALAGNIGVTGKNFLFVSLYISFVNSLLEEFFFRGFAFLTLRRVAPGRFAYVFSAMAFALYHVAMMVGWFDIPVFLVILAGLFAGGIIFNYLNQKSGTLYPSWLTHMFANFAINTIGFMLFDII